LLKVLTTKEIGASSDSLWSNSGYDALYDKQLAETDSTARHAEVAQMQQIMYDEAPYHVLYYPSQLDANRTDRFGGWKNQPSQNGNPLFGFGPLDYTYLTDANAPAPSPSASAASSSSPGASEAAVASAPAATASAAPAPVPTNTSSSGSPVLLIVGIVVLVAALAVGFVMLRRGREAAEEE
jgi:cobalamin biosynthesis Mg chelatase CobN